MGYIRDKSIDLVICSYCGIFIDTRDDREPIYRLTIGYLKFIYVCYGCTEENKQSKGGKKWVNDIK